MKPILLIAFALLTGCTTVRENGVVVFSTCSDLTGVHFRSAGGSVLDIEKVSNSAIHGAIGGAIGKGAAGIGAGIATSGLGFAP